MKETATLWT